MPRAPELQRQVADAPFPNVRVGAAPTSDTYGGQVGDTVSHASVRMYDLENRAANHAAVLEAETQAGQAQLRIQQDMLNLRGKEASNAPQYVQETWDQENEKIMAGLSNNQQRGMYMAISSSKRDTLNRAALHHFNQQNEQFQEDTFKTNIGTSIDIARANASDPFTIANEKDHQAREIRARAVRLGWEQPQIDDAIRSVHSKTNTEVIHGLLAQDQDQSAKAYYDKALRMEHANPLALQFTASDRDAVEKSLLEGSTRGESRRTVQGLVAKYGMGTVEQEKQILSDIDAIKNDKVADLARDRALHLFSVNKQQRAEAESQNFMHASTMIDEVGLKSRVAHVRDMIPPDVWTTLTPADQATLQRKRDLMLAPEERPHDILAWRTFSLLDDAHLAKMKPADVTRWVVQFDKAHEDRALTDINAAINKAQTGGKDPKFVSALTNRERINNSWIDSGLAKNPKKLTPEETIWFNRYETEADKALSALPKDAKPEEVDKVLNGLKDKLLKQKYTVDPGMFRFNKDVPAIGMPDVKDPRSIRVPLKEIPAPELDTLKGLLRTADKPVTNDKLERLYALRKMLQGGQMTKEAAKAAMKAIILE